MPVGLAKFILEAFASQVVVEGFIGLDCVLLEYLFFFHLLSSMFVIVFILVFSIEKPPASVTSQGAMVTPKLSCTVQVYLWQATAVRSVYAGSCCRDTSGGDS